MQIEINIVEMLAGLIIGACANNAKNKSCPIITTMPAPIHVDKGEMEMEFSFPSCMRGYHIYKEVWRPPPAMNHTDYYNRKGFYSVILQGVVDANYLFEDIYVGWPGSVHDSRVFVNSSLYNKAINKEILQGNIICINDTNVPVFLIGDAGYPLLPWLLKPFPHNTNLSSQQKTFNYCLSRARIVSENALGRLKARWRRPSKQNDMDIRNVPNFVAACCILHNLCEVHGEDFDNDWMELVGGVIDVHVPNEQCMDGGDTDDDIREAIMTYVHNNLIN